MKIVIAIIQIFFLLIGPFLFLGIINKVKAAFAGRKGPSLWQPVYDFIKLMRKGQVVSPTTTIIFRYGPAISTAALIFAAILIPLVSAFPLISFKGDFILFAYILALGKLFTVLNAMDTGSSFEGMGASRETSFTGLIEPAFLVLIASIAFSTGYQSFKDILIMPNVVSHWAIIVIVLSVIALFIMMIVEGSRVPFDDPNTHLELTMVHEVMVLDNSGPDLGLIQYGSGLKLYLFSALIANLIMPSVLSEVWIVCIFAATIAICAVILGTIESLLARVRLTHIPEMVLSVVSISLLIFGTVLIRIVGGIK